MAWTTRFISAVGAATAALAAYFTLSVAVSSADAVDPVTINPADYYTCDGAVCLVMGEAALEDWHYSGMRPFVTDWQGTQGYDVVFGGADGSPINAGSYEIKIQDDWSPFYQLSQYHYGDFVPTDAASGLDLGWFDDLSGASMYNVSFFDGWVHQLTMYGIGPHDATYYVDTFGDFTNTTVLVGGVSADYIQFGDAEPVFLWNSLFHAGLAELQVPDYVVPADPFAGIDFNPDDFLWGGLATV